MTDIVTSITYDDSGVQAAGRRIEQANQQIVASTQRVMQATDKVGASTAKAAETERQMIPALTGSSAAFDRLKRSLDPAYDAQKRMEKATRDADAAIRAGRASIDDKAYVLARLSASLTPAASGMRGLGVASAELQSRLAGLSGQAGLLGAVLARLGPGGVAAAAGLGAIVISVELAVRKARDLTEHFDRLSDQAARLGLSAEKFQELSFAFGQESDEAESMLTKFSDTLGDVLAKGPKTPEETASAFSRLGISLRDVQQHGNDLPFMLDKIAAGLQGIDSQSERISIARTLFGREGAKALPALQ